MTVKEHYDNHLADIYSWMIGDFGKGKDIFKEFCMDNNINSNGQSIAVDLGAGNGIQSIALAELGFVVMSVDFNKSLLFELNQRIKDLSICLIEDDIRNIKSIINSPVDLIICCGDTISHLETKLELTNLIRDSYGKLNNNGKLILSFRDYTSELSGINRFIPVKSDENRILTCVIDYFEEKITVTDLLHEKNNGKWTQKISSYSKLRIRTDVVLKMAEKIGFEVVKKENLNRMIHLILKK